MTLYSLSPLFLGCIIEARIVSSSENSCGTEDAILPFDHGQALADGIPNAKLMVLEGVGHEIPEQMTEEITSRMIEHFNSI